MHEKICGASGAEITVAHVSRMKSSASVVDVSVDDFLVKLSMYNERKYDYDKLR